MAFGIVVAGTSLGGLHTLETLLGDLPADFQAPVAIVQHRHTGADDRLSEPLQRRTVLPAAEAEDKEAIGPGHAYLAPADYHLLVDEGSLALSTDPAVCHARPSIDVLFESAANAYDARAIRVILTGASQDGADGLAAIERHGDVAVVQDPATAESGTMCRKPPLRRPRRADPAARGDRGALASSPDDGYGESVWVNSLRESTPEKFNDMVRHYGDLMELALEQHGHKVDCDLSEKLQDLAERLGFLNAGPQDVVDVHIAAMGEGGAFSDSDKQRPRELRGHG